MTNFMTSTTRDALFKSSLTHPDTARDLMEIRLPKDLRRLYDLGSLRLESASFVSGKLWALRSDILWSVKTREDDGYTYVVIEHQSRGDIHMAFCLIRYFMAVIQRHIGHDKCRQLLLIIPMLLCHGNHSPYPWSLYWLDELADPTAARRLYTAAFPLVSIAVVPDGEIMQYHKVALLELVQKHICQHGPIGLIDQLVVLLVTECANDSQVTALLNYILLTGDGTRFNEFISEITHRLPQQRERIIAIAERIHNDGYIKGEQRILRLFLQNGVNPEWIQEITGLPAGQIQALEQSSPEHKPYSWLKS